MVEKCKSVTEHTEYLMFLMAARQMSEAGKKNEFETLLKVYSVHFIDFEKKKLRLYTHAGISLK